MKKILTPLSLAFFIVFLILGCQTAPQQRAVYENWHSKIIGTYKGFIWSDGIETQGITRISKDQDGNFIGDYEFMEKGVKITGELYGFQIISPLGLICKWRDKYGTGSLSMSFNDTVTEFSGRWNIKGRLKKHPWGGSKQLDQ